LAEIRKRAVLRVEAGESPELVISTLGFSRSCIYDWLAKYREGGMEALEPKPIPGRPRKLSGPQLQWLCRTLIEKNPLQLRFEFALWTRAMIREVIREQFGVRLSEVSVGRLLRKLGFSPQKPLYRAYQQNPEAVQRWLEEEYPAIRRLAEAEGALIYFADEAGMRSDFHRGTTWAPVGQTPVVKTTGARFSLNLISAISAQGLIRFMTVEGKLNGEKFVEFLDRLLHNSRRPIFLIVDGHPAHRAAVVKRFVESSQGRLRLFYLPSYSPELNPDESVWRHLKTHNLGRARITGPDDLKRQALIVLRRLQKTPALVKAFFKGPTVRYALA
jgi:transposase